MFKNDNNWDLGELQEGRGTVGDVRLPPWANGSADEFVRLNRAALESEYVSMNLHHWIDLVFGDKQTGEKAIKAHNVFHMLTYEDARLVLDGMEEYEREAFETQVRSFGQTPSQLLDAPHQRRLPLEECVQPLCSDESVV